MYHNNQSAIIAAATMLPTASQMQQNSNADQKLLPRFPTPSDSVISGGGDDTAPATSSVLGGGGGGMGPSEDIWDLDSNTVKRYTVLDPVSISAPLQSASMSIGDQNSNPWSPVLNQAQHSSYSSWGGPGSNSSTSSTSVISNPLPEFQSNFPASATTNGSGAYDFYQSSASTGSTPSPAMQHCNSSKNSFQQQPTAAAAADDLKRPKSYQCDACDKWFTSSGHLKRHFNTTLHKNAMRQRSGDSIGGGGGGGGGRGSPLANGKNSVGNITPSSSPLDGGHVQHPPFPTYLQQINSGGGAGVSIIGDSSSINTTPPLDIVPTTSQMNNSTYQQNQQHPQQQAHHNFNQQSQHQGRNLTSLVPNHQVSHLHHHQGPGMPTASSVASSSATSASPLYVDTPVVTSTGNAVRNIGEENVSPGVHHMGDSPGQRNPTPPGDSGLKLITNSDCMFSGADVGARNSTFYSSPSHATATAAPDLPGSRAYDILHGSPYSSHMQQQQQQQQQQHSNSPVSDTFLLVSQQQYGYAITADERTAAAAITAEVGSGNSSGTEATTIGTSAFVASVRGSSRDPSHNYQANGFDYNAGSMFGTNDVIYNTTTSSSSTTSQKASTPPLPSTTPNTSCKLKVKDNKNEKEQQNGEFRCHECNKVFNRICYLKQHNKTFHNGEKPVSN